MFEILLLAFALSMDAFAVSIGLGVKSKKFNLSFVIKVALLFGFFQGFMPLIGYLASVGADSFVSEINNYLASAILIIIGIKMIYESFSENTEEDIQIVTNRVLLTLAIATSIDAMGAGFSLNLLSINPFLSMIIIAVVTFIFSIIGLYIGLRGGTFLESRAEMAGGVILILIGLNMLKFYSLHLF
jgi:putative Mn2+ efflux pump MntP